MRVRVRTEIQIKLDGASKEELERLVRAIAADCSYISHIHETKPIVEIGFAGFVSGFSNVENVVKKIDVLYRKFNWKEF